MILTGEFVEGVVPARAADFAFGQFDEAFEPARVAVAEQRVVEHGAERGREREREGRVHAVAPPAVQHVNQREIGFGDGFEQPAFFQELFMFRVAHKGQMRVQDDGEITLHDNSMIRDPQSGME